MDIGFLLGWAKEQGVKVPQKSDGSANINELFALYDEWKKKGGESKSESASDSSANDFEKSVDKLAKREKAIKLGSGADTQRYFLNDDNFLRWEKGLSQEEKDAIKYYTSDGYKEINSLLRKVGDWNADEKIWQYIANPSLRPPKIEAKREDESFPEFFARIRAAGEAAEIWRKIRAYDFIKRRGASLKQSVLDFELSDDIITYRVIGEDAAADILPNSHYTDAGYMSTSPTLESSAIKKDKALMIIKVPKGKGRGAYVGQETMVSGEYEFLLNAGSRFAVTDKRKENGRTVITMEMII